MQNAHIASTIKNRCKFKGITISTLLSDCNLTKSFIYDLEKRATSPSCDKISRIADYLDCSVDYLLGRTDNPEINKGTTSNSQSVLIRAAHLNPGATQEQIDAEFAKQ